MPLISLNRIRLSRHDILGVLLAGCSLAFLNHGLGLSGMDLFVLVFGLSLCYLYILALDRLPGSEKPAARKVFLVIVAAVFIFRRPISFLPDSWSLTWIPAISLATLKMKMHSLPPHWRIYLFPNVGLAFLVLKVVSFVLDDSTETLENRRWSVFLAYCLFAPTYLAGPIFDYQYFCRQLTNLPTPLERSHLFLQGVQRLILGLFKLVVLAHIAVPYTFNRWPARSLAHLHWYWLLLIINMTFLNLYFNFAGYTDLAIGVSNCLGMSMPENFKYPFNSRNLRDFWNRWHISFLEWLRTYIYFPLNRQFMRVTYFRARPFMAAVIAVLLTFLVMGLWHGIQLNYVLYGLMQGLGFAILMIYEKMVPGQETQRNFPVRLIFSFLSRLITLEYIAISLLLFFADSPSQWDRLWFVLKNAL